MVTSALALLSHEVAAACADGFGSMAAYPEGSPSGQGLRCSSE